MRERHNIAHEMENLGLDQIARIAEILVPIEPALKASANGR